MAPNECCNGRINTSEYSHRSSIESQGRTDDDTKETDTTLQFVTTKPNVIDSCVAKKSYKTAPLHNRYNPDYLLPQFHKKFLQAVYPHVSSFNTFLDFFIPEIVKDLDSIYIDPLYDRDKNELDPFYVSGDYLKIYIKNVTIGKPIRLDAIKGRDNRLFPRACRNGHSTYGAPLYVEFVHDIVGQNKSMSFTKKCGIIPLMVKSNRCHLNGLSPKEIIANGEECNEAGGYFIINGNERVIRFVVQQRCNHPIALKKPRLADRDLFFTDSAVLMRCAKRDGTSTTNILFYTSDKQCAYRALINRQEVVVPFWTLLRSLMPSISMDLIKKKLFQNQLETSTHPQLGKSAGVMRLSEMEMLWKDFVDQETLFCDIDKYENRFLHQLGKLYWDLVGTRLKPGSRFEDAARYVIDKYILVHCNNWTAKFEALLLMYWKLLALVRGEISAENIDSFAYQEVITPGHLFASVLKDSLQTVLVKIRQNYLSELRIAIAAEENPVKVIESQEQFHLILRRVTGDIPNALGYFMATGNIRTYQLDLQQLSGWTVVADRLNVNRFLSHFRAVHRGQFFAQMRTTEVRKLLGETWGFLCPVHTPDGGPCGLLLHLSQGAIPVTDPPDGKALAAFKIYLHQRGIPVDLTGNVLEPPVVESNTFPLVFDGQPLCHLPRNDFDYWVNELRRLKQEQLYGIPQHLEVAAFKNDSGAFEGIYIFSYPGRLVRAVKHIESKKLEWIGPLGQPWLNIACLDSEVIESVSLIRQQEEHLQLFTNRPNNISPPRATIFKELVEQYCQTKQTTNATEQLYLNSFSKIQQTVPIKYTHVELTPTSILSITSALTPFSGHNQSPRNMYQCQMLKQTMATPFHSIPYRTDNKSYRLLNPQLPIVRTKEYRDYNFDDYPSGTNAVVAVISHTGFDMEDAMILNKGSLERGAFHGLVYKTKIIDAAPLSVKGLEARQYIFHNSTPYGKKIVPELGLDGLPVIGTMLQRDSPFYRTIKLDHLSSQSMGRVTLYHDDEIAYVDKINFILPEEIDKDKQRSGLKGVSSQRISIRLRCIRNPIVGDKFASRAGQKGILSLLWPHEDMPFTASGIVPDIVFNPHGFPSRMTVGMLIESMAGKSAAIHGAYQDCTSFREFPKQETFDVPWIDQGGYNGWMSRGKRYQTLEEKKKDCSTDTSVDYFGKALLKAGYQYYGNELLYSGLYGNEMTCHIFMGVIYYQRLRHMVSDKWQVRSTGPIDALTRQPIKGRKRGGGVRFGEMERDALLAHGTACILQDRLMHCSDEHKAFVCPSCGSILSPSLESMSSRTVGGKKPVAQCRVCQIPCRLIALPYVFRYVCNELAAMNVTIRLKLTQGESVLNVQPKTTITSTNHPLSFVKNRFDIVDHNTPDAIKLQTSTEITEEVNTILGQEEILHTHENNPDEATLINEEYSDTDSDSTS